MRLPILALIAGIASGQTLFKGPNGESFSAKGFSVEVVSGVPILRGTLENSSGSRWASARVLVASLVTCQDGTAFRWKASVSPGGLKPGPNEVSEAVVASRREFERCSSPNLAVESVTFESGETFEAWEARSKVADKAKRDAEEELARDDLEKRRRAVENCHATYLNTASKKLSDITVAEDRLIRACEALGLYR
jgi:hypothetical protein